MSDVRDTHPAAEDVEVHIVLAVDMTVSDEEGNEVLAVGEPYITDQQLNDQEDTYRISGEWRRSSDAEISRCEQATKDLLDAAKALPGALKLAADKAMLHDAVKHELDEAKSEIGRHHEFIAWLRQSLEWALDHVYEPENRDERDRIAARVDEIRTRLNREVGE